jgi:hypothetical protein
MKEIISGITSPCSAGVSEPINAANFSMTDMAVSCFQGMSIFSTVA